MYMWIQNCSLLKVADVFFKEPSQIHFIKEISRKIDLAPTSVRTHIETLRKEKIIMEKEGKPFSGWIANRDFDDFLFNKKIFNLLSLKNLISELKNNYYPSMILLFGSYSRGEDLENSDIDLLIITKSKKDIDLRKFEKEMARKINLSLIDNVHQLDK